LNIRKYDDKKDFDLLSKWFQEWDWTMWDRDAISPFSYIVEKNNKPIVFSSYYRTIGTNMAKMGFTIGDINSNKEDRRKATDLILDFIFKECDEVGIKYLYYSTDVETMAKRFQEKGAIITDPGDAWICCKTFGNKTAEFLSDG